MSSLGEPTAFEAIARECSEDPESAEAGGAYPGWIGESADPLHEAAARLEPGEVGKPFRLRDSLYMVQVVERRPPTPVSLEEVAPAIRDSLRSRRHDELSRELQERRLAESNVVI